jgi:hypothetical protein
MSWITKRGFLAGATAVLAVSGLGASASGASAEVAASTGVRTNLVLRAGIDFDFPPFSGTRALSAAPVFEVTGDALRLDVRRTGAVVRVHQDGVLLPVRPRSVLQGLPGFFRWRLVRTDGTVAASATMDVCPQPGTVFSMNTWGFFGPFNNDPANPATPAEFPDPLECGDPLTTRARWGFANGWAAQLHVTVPDDVEPGPYTLDAVVNPDGGIRETSRADDRVQMPVEVLDIGGGGPVAAQVAAARQEAHARTGVARQLGRHANTRSGSNAEPTSAGTTAELAAGARVDLPDLVPLPSENIATRNDEGPDLLRFNSTLANLGRGRIQIEGFRESASDHEMLAYQVLFRDGVPAGRRPAGVLEHESEHTHWHFAYLARYRLIDAQGRPVAESGKVGFCMANVHQINAGLPGFVVPDFLGFIGCGNGLSRSVRMWMDPGWGDEYDQITPGQALDITGVPNGRYRIQILADPDRKLLEASRANNESLRTIVLGGVPGARTVTVPPIDGVDTEAAWAAIDLPF